MGCYTIAQTIFVSDANIQERIGTVDYLMPLQENQIVCIDSKDYKILSIKAFVDGGFCFLMVRCTLL